MWQPDLGRLALLAALMPIVACGADHSSPSNDQDASIDVSDADTSDSETLPSDVDASDSNVGLDVDAISEDTEASDTFDIEPDVVDPNDRDGDGVTTALDCDDDDERLGAIELDGDCDGVLAVVDCDDADPANVASNVDDDGDGFSACFGDCCDDVETCSHPEWVNAAAAERLDGEGAGIDDDCDGEIDEVATHCDAAIDLDSDAVDDAAAAIGMCDYALIATGHGVISSRWARANGATTDASSQIGITGLFGDLIEPREGSSMLVLSTGRARDEYDPDYCPSVTCNGTGAGELPAGFPLVVPDCDVSTQAYDDIAYEVTLRVPTNATGLGVDLRMFAQDYPELVCTAFNDQAIVLLAPAPSGTIGGNIAFDSRGAPLGVNFVPFDTCDGCGLGDADLAGTGFDRPSGGGATAWVRTHAPVTPGSTITLRFAIWDSGDQNFDSTLLVDNFAWTFGEAPNVSTIVAP